MKKITSILAASSLLCLAVILTIFSDEAAVSARDALKVCALSVVPSLFPYMVVSQLLVSSRALEPFGKILPVARLFSLPAHSSTAILLGAVCGFPVGAKTAAELYRDKKLSKTEAEVLISAANNTGPSFVVFVVGWAFWGSRSFGWKLYIFQLVSSALCAFFVNRVLFPFKGSKGEKTKTELKAPDFFRAVSDSAASVVCVSGFIVFFSVVTGLILPLLSGISPTLSGIVAAVLEFTGGARLASSVGGAQGRFLTGLSIGWSGLCVFCQTAAFCSPLGLSLKRTVVTKALQGIVCGLLCVFFASSSELSRANASFPAIYDDAALLLSSPVPTVIISAILYIFLIKKLVKDYKI